MAAAKRAEALALELAIQGRAVKPQDFGGGRLVASEDFEYAGKLASFDLLERDQFFVTDDDQLLTVVSHPRHRDILYLILVPGIDASTTWVSELEPRVLVQRFLAVCEEDGRLSGTVSRGS